MENEDRDDVLGGITGGGDADRPEKMERPADNGQRITAILGLLLWIVGKAGLPLAISGDDLVIVAGGVAVILGAVNTYLTTATTEKKGFAPKQEKAEGIGD